MRRLPTAFLVAFACLLAVAGAGATAALAQEAEATAHVDVIEVIGLVDDIQVDFVKDALREAEEGGAEALVIQVNSRDGIVDDATLDILVLRLTHSPVPVAAWVGPSGARAIGPAFRIVQAAGVSGTAARARIGNPGRTVSADKAVEEGLVDVVSPTLGDFVVELDGRTVNGQALDTAEVIRTPGEDPRRRPIVEVRFAKLGLMARLLHSAASPSVAYLLFAAGLGLIILEFYTAGVGMAAATGAICLLLSCYGLAALPTRPYAIALMVFAFFGFAVDVQAGAPRAWTFIGTASLALASVRLYEDGFRPSPLVLATVMGGSVLLMVAGLPAMLRSRFATPTIGRESMIGEVGAALDAVDPDGTVEVRGASWRARTNRATPIGAGENIRVVGIDGLLLEVEPEDGGAKDYRRH